MALRPLSKPLTFDRKSLQKVQETETTTTAELPSVSHRADPIGEAAEQHPEPAPVLVEVQESRPSEHHPESAPSVGAGEYVIKASDFKSFLLSNAQIERYLDANPDIKGMFCDSKTRWSYGEKITMYEPINWKLVGKYIFWIDSSKQVHMDPRKWDDALPPAMPGGMK